MQITMGGQKVCWKLERAHSSAAMMLFWIAAGSFDRLQRVRAQEKESQPLVITAWYSFLEMCRESQDEYSYLFQTSMLVYSASVAVLFSFSRDKTNWGCF